MNRPTAILPGTSLVWEQPKALSRAYELKTEETVVGRLRFEKFCGSLALAEVGSETWTFKRVGFLAPRVTARLPGSEVDVALFRPHWGAGGRLSLSDGQQLEWRRMEFWGSQWAFVASDTHAVVGFDQHHRFSRASARVTIHRSSLALPAIAILVALGWYLLILAAADDAAIIATSTVVS